MLSQAQRLPWTHEGLDGWLRKGQDVDLSMDAPPDGDDRFQKEWKMTHQQLGSMRHDKQIENWRCRGGHREALHVPEVKQCCHKTH